jgi:GWxTD domain-containing protein
MKSFLLLLVLAPAVFADSLGKYKEWDTSPQGYFMTKAEHARWAEIKSDAEAEQFVNQFIAARPAAFAADVAKRAEMADKYLTVGKTPGSKTLRGKVVILLGPPKALNISPVHRSSSSIGMAASVGRDEGPNPADKSGTLRAPRLSAGAQSEGVLGEAVNEYAFTYAGDKLPAAYAKGLTITVLVDPGSGKDQFAERKQATELDELFELVAESRMSKP